jgi:CheY-like chemotaxis protein
MAERSAGSGQQKQNRSKRFLLVVDGNARDCYTTGLLLQQFGYNVCTLQTAQQALEILSAALPALVITELTLPGTSGLDLLAQIRKNPRTATLPVLVLTSVDNSQIEQRCAQAGCTAYLKKPIPAEELYRAVQSAIEETPRASIRIPVSFQAEISGAPGPAGISDVAVITALSENGMFVKTLRPRPVKARVSVSFMIEGRAVAAEALVLYSYPPGDALFRDPGMGMEFAKLAPEDRLFLQKYIRERVTEGIAPLQGG